MNILRALFYGGIVVHILRFMQDKMFFLAYSKKIDFFKIDYGFIFILLRGCFRLVHA